MTAVITKMLRALVMAKAAVSPELPEQLEGSNQKALSPSNYYASRIVGEASVNLVSSKVSESLSCMFTFLFPGESVSVQEEMATPH